MKTRTLIFPLTATEPGLLLRVLLAGELVIGLLLQAEGLIPAVATRAFQVFLRF